MRKVFWAERKLTTACIVPWCFTSKSWARLRTDSLHRQDILQSVHNSSCTAKPLTKHLCIVLAMSTQRHLFSSSSLQLYLVLETAREMPWQPNALTFSLPYVQNPIPNLIPWSPSGFPRIFCFGTANLTTGSFDVTWYSSSNNLVQACCIFELTLRSRCKVGRDLRLLRPSSAISWLKYGVSGCSPAPNQILMITGFLIGRVQGFGQMLRSEPHVLIKSFWLDDVMS